MFRYSKQQARLLAVDSFSQPKSKMKRNNEIVGKRAEARFEHVMSNTETHKTPWVWGQTRCGIPVTPIPKEVDDGMRLFHPYFVEILPQQVAIGHQGDFWLCRIFRELRWVQQAEELRLSLLKSFIMKSHSDTVEAIAKIEDIIPERLSKINPELPNQWQLV